MFGDSLRSKKVRNIADGFARLLRECNAVPYNHQTRNVLDAEAIAWSGRTIPVGGLRPEQDPSELPVDPSKIVRFHDFENVKPVLGVAYERLCVTCDGRAVDWTKSWNAPSGRSPVLLPW